MTHVSTTKVRQLWNHQGFQRYLKSTGWSLVSRFLSMVVSFLATTYIARNLGPLNYGQLSYAVSFVGLFAFIASLGIDNVLYRELIKNPTKNNSLLGTAFILKILAGVVAALICGVTALFVVENDVSKILVFILTGTFILNSFQIINHEFQATVASKYPSIITIYVTTILNILKILTVYFHKGVIYLSLILLLESILYAILYVYIYHHRAGGHISRWTWDPRTAKSLLYDSWPLMFSTAFALIYSRIDQVFIKHMLDVQSVGVYDAAVRIAEVWYILPGIIITALFPAIINAKKTSASMYYTRLKRLGMLLIVLATCISFPVTLFAQQIMNTLYGSGFAGGIVILQIYVWATLGIFLGALVTNYLLAENERVVLFFTSLVPMILNVILNILWIPEYGIVGAAYATLISYSFVPLSIILFPRTRKALYAIISS